MQKVLKWFASILFIGVTIFLIFFLVSVNSIEDIQPKNITFKSDEEVVESPVKTSWLDKLSQNERMGYFFPVNEIYIKVDLEKSVPSNTIYRLLAPKLDPYQLFCLKEELHHHNLKYSITKEKDSFELLIYSKDLSRLNSLVTTLKNYQILAKVTPFKEDK